MSTRKISSLDDVAGSEISVDEPSEILSPFDHSPVAPGFRGIGFKIEDNIGTVIRPTLTQEQKDATSLSMGFYIKLEPETGRSASTYTLGGSPSYDTHTTNPPVQYEHGVGETPAYGVEGYCLICMGETANPGGGGLFSTVHQPCIRLLRRADKDAELGGEVWQWYSVYYSAASGTMHDYIIKDAVEWPETKARAGYNNVLDPVYYSVPDGDLDAIYCFNGDDDDPNQFILAGESYWIELQLWSDIEDSVGGINPINWLWVKLWTDGNLSMFHPHLLQLPGDIDAPWTVNNTLKFGILRVFSPSAYTQNPSYVTYGEVTMDFGSKVRIPEPTQHAIHFPQREEYVAISNPNSDPVYCPWFPQHTRGTDGKVTNHKYGRDLAPNSTVVRSLDLIEDIYKSGFGSVFAAQLAAGEIACRVSSGTSLPTAAQEAILNQKHVAFYQLREA